MIERRYNIYEQSLNRLKFLINDDKHVATHIKKTTMGILRRD